MRNFFKEFKDFIATGNMVEVAIGLILAGVVGAVIKVFTEDIVMNLVAALVGQPSFDKMFRLKVSDKDKLSPDGKTVLSDGTYLEFGKLLTSIVTLIITGLVLFMLIRAYNKMKKPAAADAGPSEIDLLTEIRDSLKARN